MSGLNLRGNDKNSMPDCIQSFLEKVNVKNDKAYFTRLISISSTQYHTATDIDYTQYQ